MRHIIHDTIVLMQKERIVPSRGKNIFEDQQKAQHSVRSHANKYFIKRESFSRQFVSLVPSSVSVCLTTAKKRAQHVNNGFHSLMLTKHFFAPNWCILSIRAKIQTNDWQIYERWGEFIPFLFYIMYFKIFFVFAESAIFVLLRFMYCGERKTFSSCSTDFCILFCPIFSIVLWSLHTFCQKKKFTDISQRLREIITHQ